MHDIVILDDIELTVPIFRVLAVWGGALYERIVMSVTRSFTMTSLLIMLFFVVCIYHWALVLGTLFNSGLLLNKNQLRLTPHGICCAAT